MLVPGVLWLIAAGPGFVLLAVVAIVLLGIREFYHLIEAKGAHPLWGFGLAAGAALPVVAYLGNEYHATILMTAVLLAVMVAQVGKAQITEALASISGTFFGVFYVGWLLSHAVTLRNFQRVVESKWGAGAALALRPGLGRVPAHLHADRRRALRRRRVLRGPRLGQAQARAEDQPGQDGRGRARRHRRGHRRRRSSARASSICSGPTCRAVCRGRWRRRVALVLATAGMIGDLVESLLKRDAAQKDAGSLLPGMGGVLDRIDSALLAIPVMYYLMLATTYLRAGFR